MPITRDRPGAIELAMSEKDKAEFLDLLRNTPGLTIRRIKELANERGIECGMGAADTFRKGEFARHLAALEEASEITRMAQDLAASGDGAKISDASAAVLAVKVFKKLTSDEETTDKTDNTRSLTISRLRTGDHRMRMVESKLAEAERKAAAATAAADQLSQPSATGMTIKERNRLRAELGLPLLEEAA